VISDKIQPQHLARKALLYVRQSSPHQVLHNKESSTLQYAMRNRLTELGWFDIEVIDDDLGRSAAGGVQRAGFERMVAEVCLGKVGAVCAVTGWTPKAGQTIAPVQRGACGGPRGCRLQAVLKVSVVTRRQRKNGKSPEPTSFSISVLIQIKASGGHRV